MDCVFYFRQDSSALIRGLTAIFWTRRAKRKTQPALDGAAISGDDERRSVSASMQSSGVKNRIKSFGKLVCKRVDMNPWLRTEEGHMSLIIVQINGHHSGFGGERQTGWWQRVGHVLISIPQAECPEAVCRTDGKFPLPVNRVLGHTEVPVYFVSDFHFPVVSTWEQSFLSHHIGNTVKPFGIFGDFLLLGRVSDLLPVIRDGEVTVSRARVQSDLHCEKETRPAFQRNHHTRL